MGACLFGQDRALALPLPLSVPDLLLTPLEIGQQCHFLALCVVNLHPHSLHC
jgi:hypothetical protein